MNAPRLVKSILMPLCLTCSAWAQNENVDFINRPPVPDGYNEVQTMVFKKVNDRFHIHSGIVLEVYPDGLIGYIKTVLINNGLTADNPVERAYQLFENQKDLLQIADPGRELVFDRFICNKNGSGLMHFDQVIGGVKVFLGGCNIYFDSTGIQLTQFNVEDGGGLLPDAHKINPVPEIDSLEAAGIVLADTVYQKNNKSVYYGGLWIANLYDRIRKFPDHATHLVWRIGTECKMYSVDAHTGKILSAEQNCSY